MTPARCKHCNQILTTRDAKDECAREDQCLARQAGTVPEER